MPKIGDLYKQQYELCKQFGVLSADLRILIAHNEGFEQQIDVIYHKEDEMKHPSVFLSQCERLRKGEPVEYIINESQFLGKNLYVDKNVLIPRNETEEMISYLSQKVSSYFDPRNYLMVGDIGTGSGAIILGVKSLFPNWVCAASDIKEEALKVAKKNFDRYSIQVDTRLGDALDPWIKDNTKFDILISNPPYIMHKEDAQQSVIDYEPDSALWLTKENDVYEKIFRDVYKVKRGALLLVFEISPDLVNHLNQLMEKYLHDYEYEFIKDLSGFDRFLFVYLKDEEND